MSDPFRYRIVVEWSDADEAYVAHVPALPGCEAQGRTIDEAVLRVRAEAESFIQDLQQKNRPVPPEDVVARYSGQVSVHLPRSLHARLSRLASVEGVPLDQVMMALILQQSDALAVVPSGPPTPSPRAVGSTRPRGRRESQRTPMRPTFSAPPVKPTPSSSPFPRKAGLVWEVKQRGDRTLVLFSGEVDEYADFKGLTTLSGNVVFDMAAVTRFNSEGVRAWIGFINSLPAVTELAFVRCSVATVNQMNLFDGLKGKGEVRSFYAPYYCTATGEEELRLLTREELPDPMNPPRFPYKGGELVMDEAPERYLAFLIDAQTQSRTEGPSQQ
jgi:predicted RNase H-like HicB family nuclease